VADGALQAVSPAALPLAAGVLAEHGPRVRVRAAERHLVRRQGVPPLRDLLLLGSGTGAGGEPLPGVAAELAAVTRIWRGDGRRTTLRAGPAATVAALREGAAACDVLHIAGHGLRPAAADGLDGVDPMLASALRLAPAAGGRDDGLLTAEECLELDLRGVALAVLSACDSGRGRIERREGVAGLRRALLAAGCRSLVVTAWPVPDAAARRWMEDFYTALRDGCGVDDAARGASLAELARQRDLGHGDHPNGWGGFLAVNGW
jgi:CHAT domain-containing protein